MSEFDGDVFNLAGLFLQAHGLSQADLAKREVVHINIAADDYLHHAVRQRVDHFRAGRG